MVDGLQSLICPLCSKFLLILLRRTLKIFFQLMDLLVQAKPLLLKDIIASNIVERAA